MNCKTVCLIINPHAGEHIARLTDVLAVLSAAGWKTDTVLKEFGGHAEQLAKEAAEEGHDLVLAYGGDGTLNDVVNGVVAAGCRRTIVGVIPGGTANIWAHEIGIPPDPVKAALVLVNSEGRKVDLGHVEMTPPSGRRASGGGHHFLLMAGLGLDASILRGVSKSRKEKEGEAAVALAAARTRPRGFPIEVRSSDAGGEDGMIWRGEALQVIVGNTRRYGNIAEMTADAYIDDGMLDVRVITGGNPLTTFGQILSVLLHRKPVPGHSEYFQGAHFSISVPAPVNLQLDGSSLNLNGSGAAADRSYSEMATYRFDAMSRALRVAVPRTYNDSLFENGSGEAKAPATEEQLPAGEVVATEPAPEPDEKLLKCGVKVTVIGVSPNPAKDETYIVAGSATHNGSGASKPVAVRINHDTTVLRSTGEPLTPAFAAQFPEGRVLVVEGKESKRGVIRAERVVVMT